MMILTLLITVVGVWAIYSSLRAGVRRAQEHHWSRPDPALVIRVPRRIFEGYDYRKASTGKLNAARRELARLEGAQPAPRAQDAPRLRVAGGRGQ